MSELPAEILIGNPCYISCWAHFHVGSDSSKAPDSWQLRWISVQNGILFWYENEVMSFPEGFVVLCNTDIQFEEKSPSNFIVRVDAEEAVYNIKLNSSDEFFWREAIDRNSKITRATMSPEEFQMEDVDKSPTSTMQIHLKGVPHVIPITSFDNATDIAEAFVSDHKLKIDIIPRIEAELLRTQIDSCLAHQEKLRKHVGNLRRLIIDASGFEIRALSAERCVRELSDTTSRINKTMPLLKNKIERLENERAAHIDELSQLKAELRITQAALTECEHKEVKSQRKLQVAVDHCRALQAKLRAAADLHRRTISKSMHATGINTIPSQDTESAYGSSSCGDMSPRDSAAAEKNDRQIQNAVYAATEQLTEAYEQKMSLYEGRVREQSKAVANLEKSQLADRNVIDSLKREATKLTAEIKTLQNEKNTAESENSRRKSHTDQLVATLNKKLQTLEEAQASLQTKHRFLQGRYDSLSKEIDERESEKQRLVQKVKDLSGASNSDIIKRLTDENKVLGEQATRLRAEVMRLNEEVMDIQSKALQAVQAVQILERDRDFSPSHFPTRPPPPPDAVAASPGSPVGGDQRRVMEGEASRRSPDRDTWKKNLISSNVKSFDDTSSSSSPQSRSSKGIYQKERAKMFAHRESSGRMTSDGATEEGTGHNDGDDDGGEKVIVELSIEEDDDDDEGGEERRETEMSNLDEGNQDTAADPLKPYRQPRDNADSDDSGSLEYEASEEVDLSAMSASALQLRMQEKVANVLSPVVEDRLLRNIFHRYALETSGLLSLSRFGRFTKEFKIAGNVAVSGRRDKVSSPMLVYGDVDVIFMTTLKNTVPEDADSPMNMVDVEPSRPRSHVAFVPPGAVSPQPNGSTPLSKSIAHGTQMTANQFITAVEELAVKLYAYVIEEKTGTVLECLPPKQREKAMRAAMDVMMVKKVAPTAQKLGLIPNELMILDQTLTVIQSNPSTAESLVSHIETVSSWFKHYAKVIQISPPDPEAKAPKSPMLYGAMSAALSRSTGGISDKKPPRLAPPPPIHIKAIPYKSISRFFHDYGIVPYLIKEPQVHSLFQEIVAWAKGNIELVLIALPENIRNLPQVQSEIQSSASIRSKLAKRKVIGLGCFFVLFSTIATQVFSDIEAEKRVGRLFQWAAQSGGSYLIMQQKLKGYS